MTDKCVLRSAALFRKSECAIKLSRKTLQNSPYFVDMRTRTYFFHFWFRAALFIVIFWSVTQGNWFDCSSLNFWRVSDYCLQKRRPKNRGLLDLIHIRRESFELWCCNIQRTWLGYIKVNNNLQQIIFCLAVNYLK